jgi:hypothetical protein
MHNTATHNNVMQVGAQIDTSLPKDAPMEDVVTITHVCDVGLLLHRQTYDCFNVCVCVFFLCIKCVDSYH